MSDLPVLAANQFVAQLSGGISTGQPDEVLLVIGHAAPPIIIGDDVADRLSQIGQIEVKPLARFSISRERFAELADLLQRIRSSITGDELTQSPGTDIDSPDLETS